MRDIAGERGSEEIQNSLIQNSKFYIFFPITPHLFTSPQSPVPSPQSPVPSPQSPLKMRFFLIFHFLLLIFDFLSPKLVQAQTRSAPASFAPKQVDSGQPRCPNPITENSISHRLTKPSLWWAEDQFGGLLLDRWFICPNERQVYLIVNRQIWTTLNYIERYEFVNHFGTYLRPNNYNVVVLNPQRRQLATYKCNYSVNPADCNVWIDTTGTATFQRQLIPR